MHTCFAVDIPPVPDDHLFRSDKPHRSALSTEEGRVRCPSGSGAGLFCGRWTRSDAPLPGHRLRPPECERETAPYPGRKPRLPGYSRAGSRPPPPRGPSQAFRKPAEVSVETRDTRCGGVVLACGGLDPYGTNPRAPSAFGFDRGARSADFNLLLVLNTEDGHRGPGQRKR
ncbi:hypothetical protein AAFF_G00434030 [Aldrovandia affinis]|uniref:Uncharacterized protein n=1 Tax=Aldrovandia affinis TaxID=143900 RepID=A0AAD7S877_9TELE|nr:hypothetical protein AAFF_G00434030 [Aldrovandia affinis]